MSSSSRSSARSGMTTVQKVAVGVGVSAAVVAVGYVAYKYMSKKAPAGDAAAAAAPADAGQAEASVSRRDSKKSKKKAKRASRKAKKEEKKEEVAKKEDATGDEKEVTHEHIVLFLNRLRGSAFDTMYQLQLHAARYMAENPTEDQSRIQQMVMQQFVQLLSAAESSLLQELEVSQSALQKEIESSENAEVKELHARFMKVVRGDLEDEVRLLKGLTEEQLGMSKETATEVMKEVMGGTLKLKAEVLQEVAERNGLPVAQLEAKFQEDPTLVMQLQKQMQKAIVDLQKRVTEKHGSTISEFDLAVRAYKLQDVEFVKAMAELQQKLVE